MLLYILLVAILVVFTIWISILIVRRKSPEYKPTPIKKERTLNDLDALVGTVKKKKAQPKPQTTEPEPKEEKKDDDFKEYSSGIDDEQKEQQEEPERTKFSGRRGRPPKRPPRTNLREAMKTSEILGKPKAQQ